MFANWLQLPMPLDHAGYGARDLGAAIGLFRRLGFAPTEARELAVCDAETGAPRPLGQLSAHVMFANGYIELSAPTWKMADNPLIPLVQRRDGLHILALATQDAQQCWASMRELLPALPSVARAAREIAYGKRRGQARFQWFPLPAEVFAEGIVCFVEHLTPDLVFQREVLDHPNQATALLGAILVSENPQRAEDRYRPFAGSGRGIARAHPQGRLRFASHADLSCGDFGLNLAGSEALVGLEMETASLGALTEALDRGQMDYRELEDAGILVALPALNSFLLFQEGC